MSINIMIDNAFAEIVLNRPDKMNALNESMMNDLMRVLDKAEDAQVRAMLIRGEGTAFCAGRDLAEADPGNEDAETIVDGMVNPIIRRIADFNAPTFAAVQGPCLGAGLGIALACDVVYAADDAKIGSPFARIGAVLDSGGHSFFVRRIGSHRALELIYSGRLLSGIEAAQWGLVNRSMPIEQLLAATRELARNVATGPTAAFMQSKRIVRMIDEDALGLSKVLSLEAKAQGAAGRTDDYKEGINAFQQKRKPTFAGR